ncbi:MAG TPA: periplasmic heavy metal sensor [Bacteroidales bacterium]|nr:periplasmic heavy metal sensor [Bacteroidales bacterium]
MKTKKMKLLAAFFIASVMVFATTATYAQCQGQKQMGQQQEQQQVTTGMSGQGCCGIKDLTPEQEKQMKALHQKMMKEVLPIKNQIAEKKAHLKTISTGDNVDLVAVNKTIDELYALKAEIEKKKQALQQDVRKLLNDEQKLMFDMHHAKGDGMGCKQDKGMGYHGKTQGKGCGMGQGMQGCGMGQGMGAAGCNMGQAKTGTGCSGMGQEMGAGKGGCKEKAAEGTGAQTPGCCKQKK